MNGWFAFWLLLGLGGCAVIALVIYLIKNPLVG